MMGRGAEGGCGTDVKNCPVSRISSTHSPPATTSSVDVSGADEVPRNHTVDFYVQAKKALAERSPFDEEETKGRVTTLPVAMGLALAKFEGGRQKVKKVAHAEAGKNVSGSLPPVVPAAAAARNIWVETEEYFRDVTLDDVDMLVGKMPSLKDSCFLIPVSRCSLDRVNGSVEEGSLDVAASVAVGGVVLPYGDETISTTAEEEVGRTGVLAADQENDTELTAEVVEEDVHNLESKDIIDNAVDCGLNDGVVVGAVQENLEGNENGSSLNWLLGSKHRAFLSSERPNKKRKLLGSDAGLDRLLQLPHLHGENEDEDEPMCDYCCSYGNASSSDKLLCCDSCKVTVHQKCYGVSDAPIGAWLCSWCKHSETVGNISNGHRDVSCLLCPKIGGALKPVGGDADANDSNLKFAHLFCSLWMPEMFVGDIKAMEPAMNFEAIHETRKSMLCYVCKVKHGSCVRCSHGTCRAPFHPMCAREANHKMVIWGKAGCDNVELRAFCSKHSSIQEISSAQKPGNVTMVVSDVFSKDNHITTRSFENKTTEARFTRKSRYKSSFEHNSDTVSKCERPSEVDDTSSVRLITEGVNANVNENIQISEDTNVGLLFIIKKLIENGKIKVNDVALEMGIPSSFLQAALMDESYVLPPKLGSKIVRWLKGSVHMASPALLPKTRSGFDTSLSDIPAGKVAANIPNEDLHDSNASVHTILGKSNAVDVGSLPLQGHIKNVTKVLNDDKTTLGNSFIKQEVNGNLYDEKEPVRFASTFVSQDSDVQMVASEGVLGDVPEHPDEGNGWMVSGSSVMRAIDLSSRYYVNPFIEKKLLKIEYAVANREANSDGFNVIPSNSSEGYLSNPCKATMGNERKLRNADTLEYSSKCKKIKLEDLNKTKASRVLDHSPQDEVEGEILYLQNKLLDAAVAIKHHYEYLMFTVASNISKELDLLKKNRWDFLLRDQFLHQVREKKKRGRKERRHREALAILSAAAASSRASLLKKDTNDEGPVTVESPSGTAVSPSQLAKEKPKKLLVSKLSHGKKFDDVFSCDICTREESLLNSIIACDGCKVAVHLACYRRCKDPISSWYCEPCEELRLDSSGPTSLLEGKEKPSFAPQCGLCGATGGAFRMSTLGQWVHAFCAEWVLESTFRRGQELIVHGMETMLKLKEVQDCCICRRKIGICVKCGNGDCQTVFHPLCARNSGLYMNMKAIGDNVQHKAYCQKHSREQRDKAVSQPPGADEVKRIRQIRVELEKLRLLCERIVKREKMKRELFLCSSDILSIRKEYEALSMILRRPAVPSPSGLSSESAMTSINNTCYSGMVDDNTVDSNISGKRKFAIPSCGNTSRKLSERSRTHRSMTQKATDGTSFSDQQLPVCSASIFSDNKNDDVKKLISKKHSVSFQKELTMTSDQASIQNQRLPKGFVYVPLDSLSKSKDIQSHKPYQPD